ncbi:MAG: DUF418 domain-containing protein [Muribaculaceae bacterium]|nr:DUF418 domain-containing protein [Muribaculaceae bacterium]
MSGNIKTDRIYGIDALRAFALLGILMVHTLQRFAFEETEIEPGVDSVVEMIIRNIFYGKSNPIFSLLFGCSFWFMLRNPAYSSLRFVWRCVLLAAIGLISKLFYTYDILMWYGACGIVLVVFRRCPKWLLLCLSLAMIVLSRIICDMKIGTALIEDNMPDRYVTGASFGSILQYPLIDSVKNSFLDCLNNFSVRTLGLMMLGYWFGCMGYITRWREVVTAKVVLMLAVATAILFATVFAVRGDGTSMLFRLLVFPQYVAQALFMSALVVYLCRNGGRLVTILACYGRLGLTNYFFQGIVGVALFCVWFAPHHTSLAVTVAVMSGFYMLQIAFSVLWCRSHRYGPLEYLWRKATGIFPSRKDSTACMKA